KMGVREGLRMRSRWLCCLLFVASCSDDTTSASMTIGPSGGQVSTGNGASLYVPPGALAAGLKITVSSTSAPPPADTTAVGTPHLFGPEGTKFDNPVTVTLAFSSDLLPADATAADIEIYTAPAGSSSYEALATTMADANHVQ